MKYNIGTTFIYDYSGIYEAVTLHNQNTEESVTSHILYRKIKKHKKEYVNYLVKQIK